ncbi:hypothetical protein N9E37_03990, partial [Luminiphilus sp.]|nr:hypothetical protein [Luminiphilus sp.]
MAYDFSNVPAEGTIGNRYWRANANPGLVGAYDAQRLEEVDPIQEAISNVAPPISTVTPTVIAPTVDSLDQAITPIASDRTTTQLFSDYGAAPQQETAVTAEPVVAPTSWVSGGPPNLNAEGINLNKELATNSYGGALKYSQLPPEDQAVVDARREAGLSSPGTPYKGATALMNEVNYGVGQQYDSPEEALSAFPSFLSSLKEKSVATDAEFNTKNYDPSEFTMAGVSPVGGVSGRAAEESAVDYLTKNNIPMSKVVDGQTRYLTTGLGSNVLYDILGEETLNKTNGDKGGSYQEMGPVGTYSTVHVDPESPLDSPFLAVVGMFLPPVALATTAMKAVTGETLHAGDWMQLATAGFKYYQSKFPPSEAQTLAKASEPTFVKVNGKKVMTETAGENAISAALDEGILDINNLDTKLYQEIYETAEGIGEGFLNSGFSKEELFGMIEDANDPLGGLMKNVDYDQVLSDFLTDKDDIKVFYQGLDTAEKAAYGLENIGSTVETLAQAMQVYDVLNAVYDETQGEQVYPTGVQPDMPDTEEAEIPEIINETIPAYEQPAGGS